MKTVIDASDSVVGRVASNVAKRLLKGETIFVVNAEKAVFTGTKKVLLKKFEVRYGLASKANPEKGPKFYRMPDRIVKIAIRGMLPLQKNTGRNALKNLRVYIGVPAELSGLKAEKIKDAENRREKGFISVGYISKGLGAKW
ncbi:MAG TPA: 50S ribosomal protein L13 [archaeon]|nr:50S ribosomal protein L13 [archaeon]